MKNESASGRNFSIRLYKEYFDFSIAHFTILDGKRENLHGHNYRVSVELEGRLKRESYVLDFTLVKRIMKDLCDELDHKTIIPTMNPLLSVLEKGGPVEVRFEGDTFLFPQRDVLLLPIANATAESFARYLCGKLVERLKEMDADNIEMVRIGVEESKGQMALYWEEFNP